MAASSIRDLEPELARPADQQRPSRDVLGVSAWRVTPPLPRPPIAAIASSDCHSRSSETAAAAFKAGALRLCCTGFDTHYLYVYSRLSMAEERATMNAIEDTRQLFNARLETLEAKIDGKLALIFQPSRRHARPCRDAQGHLRRSLRNNQSNQRPSQAHRLGQRCCLRQHSLVECSPCAP